MQFIQSFTAFVDYFRKIKETSTYFNFFESGGTEKIISERLLSDLRSNVAYPLLFLEWPTLKIIDAGSGNTQINYRTAFVVLEDPAKDDWAKQDLAMQTTLDAVHQVIQQLRIDNAGLHKKFLNINFNRITIDPIDNLFIDNACGWRCEFEIENPVDLSFYPYCRNPAFWKG